MARRTNDEVFLHGPHELRPGADDDPGDPPAGHVRLRVEAVGICGSDLHAWHDPAITGKPDGRPFIIGHEFAGVIEAVGRGAADESGRALEPGMRLAVEPATSCGRCEHCRRGHPNLCPDVRFCGIWPTFGALRRFMHVPAEACFPLPDSIDAAGGALLETLGVALHAADLGHIRPGMDVAVIGAGPVGLLLVQVARAGGAGRIFAADPLPWRLELAQELGAIPLPSRLGNAPVEVAFEATNGSDAYQTTADVLKPGGRMVVVGIPDDDGFAISHATARRKGLTIAFCRRMKHTYPRAIDLVTSGRIALDPLVTHRFALNETPEAFEVTGGYTDGVVKTIIDVG